jgi:hypothetical protein
MLTSQTAKYQLYVAVHNRPLSSVLYELAFGRQIVVKVTSIKFTNIFLVEDEWFHENRHGELIAPFANFANVLTMGVVIIVAFIHTTYRPKCHVMAVRELPWDFLRTSIFYFEI